ncbi:MAG: glycosyltransferase family 2 protein [Patescibacteria group bacterium]|nr:glycosyltransferase family 2 protein [Patescibacteria group bacterium]
MVKKTDLSIVIVNFNTRDLLRDCLKSIERSVKTKCFSSWEIIVVDNASKDKSVEMLKSEFPKIKLLASSENLGFSKANNRGIEKTSGRYVLFLNPDTLVPANTLSKMIEFMDENKKAGAATCRVDLLNGNLDDASHRGFPTPWNSFTHFSGLDKLFPQSKLFAGYSLGHLPLGKIHEIDSLVGAFMFVRREAGEEVNWWDEDYFWYGEDIDFCFRLKKRDWKIYFVPTVKVIHYKGASSGIKKTSEKVTTASKETRLAVSLASTEAMKIFYKKHYEKIYPKIVTKFILGGVRLLKELRLLKARFGK